jgi:hypothetical protein
VRGQTLRAVAPFDVKMAVPLPYGLALITLMALRQEGQKLKECESNLSATSSSVSASMMFSTGPKISRRRKIRFQFWEKRQPRHSCTQKYMYIIYIQLYRYIYIYI